MAYFSDSDELGGFGCGADCSCKSCRTAPANFSQVYEEEEIPEAASSKTAQKMGASFGEPLPPQPKSAFEPETVSGAPYRPSRFRVPSRLGKTPAPIVVERFGQPSIPPSPSAPVFTTACPVPPGCPPHPAGQCGAVLRQAVIEAIRLANNAASKLDLASTLEPTKRDKDATNTANLFRFFFGHDPSTPVPWAGNMASGTSVAHRFRAVARELGGGRRITFRCNFGPLCAGSVGVTNQAADPNVMNLCAPFWAPPASPGLPAEGFRGGTIVHEMLHMLYPDFFHHAGHPSGDPERRRDNAHCYKAFALRVGGYGRDPNATARCRARNA